MYLPLDEERKGVLCLYHVIVGEGYPLLTKQDAT